MSDSNYRIENSSYSFILPSIKALHIYGVSRSAAIYIQNNHWVISKDYRDIFKTYYLLHWDALYFQDKLQNGMVERNKIIYQIIYYRCNIPDIILAKNNNNQLLLSFRELQSEYKAQSTVLVTIA